MALTTDLVAYYKFDGDATDSVNSFDGSVGTEVSVSASGKINQAYDFSGASGTNSRIDIGTQLRGQIPTHNFSISGWFKFTANSTYDMVMGHSTHSEDGFCNFYIYKPNTNAIKFHLTRDVAGSDTGIDIETTSTATDWTQWNHVVMVANGGTTLTASQVKIYINGVDMDITINTDNDTLSGLDPFYKNFIFGGYYNTTINFDGLMDEQAIWSRALSQSEVTDLYNSGAGWQYPFSSIKSDSVQVLLNDTTDYSDFENGKVTVSTGDYNISSNFTIRYKNELGKYNSTFTISQEIDFYVYGTKVLAGIIEDIKLEGRTGHERITIIGRDYTSTLQDITIPPETYTNQDVSDIIDDFMTKYSPDVTYTPVTYGESIVRISFNHISIYDALRKLAEQVGAIFYINTDKELIFIPKSSTSSGKTLDNTNIFKATWNTTRKEIVNQVWVYGDRVLSGYSEQFTGDGVGSVFNLAYKPSSLNVTVSGVQQIGAIYEMTSIPYSGTNYLVDYDERNLIFVSGTELGYSSIPGSLVNINTSYDRELAIVKRARSTSSISAYKLREKIIQNSNIKDPNEAIALAKSELRPNPYTKGTLFYDGQDIITAGTTAVVNFPYDGINNQTYDILEVTYDLNPTNILTNNFIKLIVNKKISDVTDTIKDLIQEIKALQSSEIDTTDVLTRVEFGAGSFGFRMVNWTVNANLIGSDWYVGSPAHPNGYVGSPGSYWVGSHADYISGLLSGGTW